MTAAAIPLSAVFGLASTLAFAQGTPPTRPAPGAANWIVSETTSPVDYTPVVVATTYSRGAPDSPPMQLSIHCRGGRIEMVVAAAALSRSGEEYTLSYRINGGPPVQRPAGAALSGPGAAFRDDAARLLASLPDGGELSVRVIARQGGAQEGRFSLDGLGRVREKVVAACK